MKVTLRGLSSTALFVGLVALAACGGDGTTPVVPTPAGTAVPTPADQAVREQLRALALDLEDLPEDFVPGLRKFVSNEDAAAAAGLSPDEVQGWGRTLGFKATFGSHDAFESVSPGDLLIVEVGVDLFETPEGARQAYESATRFTTEELRERAISQHPELRDVQVESIPFPELGNDSVAWRVSAEITLRDGPTYTFVSTPMLIRSDRAVGALDVQYAYTPDEAQVEALARRFAAKLGGSP